MIKITKEKYKRIEKASEILLENVNGCRNQIDEKTYLIEQLINRYKTNDITVEDVVEKYNKKKICVIYTVGINYGSANYPNYRHVVNETFLKNFKATKCYLKDEKNSIKIDKIIGFYVV